MIDIITAFATTFRDYVTDNVPATGKHKVRKRDQRALGPLLSNAINGAAAGLVRAETWAALLAITGTRAGQPAEVVTGVATHVDPTNGDTVSNKGQYRWVTSPAGWRWIADLDDDEVRLAAAEADIAALQADLAAEVAARVAGDSPGHVTVESRTVNTPPGSPTTGQMWVVGSSPTDAWAGHAIDLARWTGSAWEFLIIGVGKIAYVRDEQILIYRRAGDWAQA